ncbi:MAG: sugar phosphate isomerase/epimerase, partial [Verrucomicrobiota bacterium]
MGPISEEELCELCRDNGLTICATHEPGDKILNEPQAIVARLKKLNCLITAYPYPSGINLATLETIKDFCRRLNTAGKALYEAGQILCYHNHHVEFQRVAG